MNKQNAIKFLPMVKALSEGKDIQYMTKNGEWVTAGSPSFVSPSDAEEWRIKPEPEVIYVIEHKRDGHKTVVSELESWNGKHYLKRQFIEAME